MWGLKRVRFLLNAEGRLQPALYKKRNPPCYVGDCYYEQGSKLVSLPSNPVPNVNDPDFVL
jgi:hypothetical protein